jgi:hypothetical protein
MVINGRQKGPVVIITGRRDEPVPEPLARMVGEYRNVQVFDIDENEFEFKTFVRVYYE